MVPTLLKYLALLAAGCALVGCGAPGTGPLVFPIIGDDPAGLVSTMEWGASPVLGTMPEERPVLKVLDTSTPEVVRVAVEGGSCPPTAQVQVSGTPAAVRIVMVLGGSIETPGVACDEDPTTHELIITFEEPIDLDRLEVSARYTVGAAGG